MPSYDFAAPRLHVQPDLYAGAVLALEQSQRNYICNVLRLKEGDDVLIFNGRDGEWRALLTPGNGRKQVALRAAEHVREQAAPGDLHYLFAPLKHARLDYMVQKAVEMGASALRPVITRRTQATRINVDRLHANAIEAAEQCGILAVPDIRAPEPLDVSLRHWQTDRVLVFCDEDATAASTLSDLRAIPPGSPLAVLIGPEGGFDPAERDALLAMPSVVRMSLGPRILRADTAAVAALAIVQAVLVDWSTE